jgi:hypothetical protein
MTAALPSSAERMTMTQQHLTNWRLSAGDETVVFDGSTGKIVDVPCGGLTRRTRAEAVDMARLIAAAPDLLECMKDLFCNENGVDIAMAGNPAAIEALEAKCRAAIARAGAA